MSAKPDEKAAQALGKGLFEQMDRQFPDMNDILWLIRNGASMSVTDDNGMTPLLRAISWGNKGILRAMVESGADVNYAGRRGVTAMQCAAGGADPEIVQLMLNAQGDVLKKDNDGQSALDRAKRNPKAEVVALIADAARVQQAAVDAIENHRRTIDEGLPVERPFRAMKRLTLKHSR